MQNITIDGKEYDFDTFTEEAKAQLLSLQFVDQKIATLQAELAVFQTARMAYSRELVALLPNSDESVH